MNFKNISAWSIRNPVVPIVMFIALTLAGLVSFMRMDVQDNPDIEFPVVIATISQPGAAPEGSGSVRPLPDVPGRPRPPNRSLTGDGLRKQDSAAGAKVAYRAR